MFNVRKCVAFIIGGILDVVFTAVKLIFRILALVILPVAGILVGIAYNDANGHERYGEMIDRIIDEAAQGYKTILEKIYNLF